MPEPHHDFDPLDPGRIDIESRQELHYWSEEFHCSEARLLAAVGRVGNHVAAVRAYLGAHHRAASHKRNGEGEGDSDNDGDRTTGGRADRDKPTSS